jgi:hypothetical protein
VFFNGRVNFTTTDDLILGYMLTGFSPMALRLAVKHGSIRGIHPKVTEKALKEFEKAHGRSPDFFQMSRYANQPHQNAYDQGPTEKLERPGQLVGIDHAYCDFNESSVDDQESSQRSDEPAKKKKVEKMKTLGGATFFSLALDYVTGFPVPRLGRPDDTSSMILDEYIDIFKTAQRPIETIVADSQIVSESLFRVFNSEVIKLLIKKGIKYQKVMPNEHSIGGNKIEVCVRYVKEKMRLAYNYVMANPNIFLIGYTERELLKLWGEVFYWAVFVYSLGPSYRDKTKSKYEDFMGYPPNIQVLRLLPIFSILLVHTGEVYEYGLYLGPHWIGPHSKPTDGAIRVAVKGVRGDIKIHISQNYKCVTQGFNVDLNTRLDRSLIQMMRTIENDLERDIQSEEEKVENEELAPMRISRRQRGLPVEKITEDRVSEVVDLQSRGEEATRSVTEDPEVGKSAVPVSANVLSKRAKRKQNRLLREIADCNSGPKDVATLGTRGNRERSVVANAVASDSRRVSFQLNDTADGGGESDGK